VDSACQQLSLEDDGAAHYEHSMRNRFARDASRSDCRPLTTVAVRLVTVLLVVASVSSACHVGDPNGCTKGEFADHCDGNVAITCRTPFATGSGWGGGATIHRDDCGSSTCGPTRICYQECDICKAVEITEIGCASANPVPLNCKS
jgi:hypothetical protein